jgi:uncharacterized protein YbjT (DUF2867 family)
MNVILGATGRVGSQISYILLKAGKNVRVIGRDATRLAPLVTRGAIPLKGDIADTAFLTGAFEGATGVFVMLPPDPGARDLRAHQRRMVGSIAAALKRAGVDRAFSLSSVGAHLEGGTGPIAGLHLMEEQLNSIGRLNVIHFRAAYFMENLLAGMNLIRSRGINGSALRGDLPMHAIATADIAEEVARHMLEVRPRGKSVRYLLGERDLTMGEMTEIIGRAIGRPGLRYVRFGYDDAEKGMIGAGLSPSVARSYVEMARAFNDGLIARVERTAENTTPTHFEDFAGRFAELFCTDGVSCRPAV